MLDSRIAEHARAAIRPVLEERREELRESVQIALNDLGLKGQGRSGAVGTTVGKLYAHEADAVTLIAWQRLWRVISTLEVPVDTLTREDLKDTIRTETNDYIMALPSLLRGHLHRAVGGTGDGDALEALNNAILRARRKIDAEIDLFVASARRPESMSAAAPVFHIYSPVGTIQTGESATASVVQYLGADDQQALVSALIRLHDDLARLGNADIPRRTELMEMTGTAKAELEKPKSNGLMLISMLSALASAIQTVGALQPAYETLKAVAGSAGIRLP